MLRTMFKSKIHRATVTQADLHYVGSVTIDADLMDAADLLPGELVHIVDITNGARLETYVIEGERGSGVDRHQRRRRPSRAPRRSGDPHQLRPGRRRRGAGAAAAGRPRRRGEPDRRLVRRRARQNRTPPQPTPDARTPPGTRPSADNACDSQTAPPGTGPGLRRRHHRGARDLPGHRAYLDTGAARGAVHRARNRASSASSSAVHGRSPCSCTYARSAAFA